MKAVNLVTEPKIDPNTLVIGDELISQAELEAPKLNVPAIFVEEGTPSTTETVPTKAGDIYIDITNSKVYIAKDNTKAADFLVLN